MIIGWLLAYRITIQRLPRQQARPLSTFSYELSPLRWLQRTPCGRYLTDRHREWDSRKLPRIRMPDRIQKADRPNCIWKPRPPAAIHAWRSAACSIWRPPEADELHDRRITEGRLDGLGIGDGGEPLRSVLLDVIVEDLAVYHELNYNNIQPIHNINKNGFIGRWTELLSFIYGREGREGKG